MPARVAYNRRMPDRRGQLLIAAADLADPHFHRTVSLLVEHSPDGALGLVLNRPTGLRVAQAWTQVSDQPCVYEGPLMWGGPCAGPLMVLHDDPTRGQTAGIDGLYFTADAEAVTQLMGDPPGAMRCFSGYAGWGSEQLESELASESWVVSPASIQDVLDPSDDVWLALWDRINPAQAAVIRHPGLMPEDPSLN